MKNIFLLMGCFLVCTVLAAQDKSIDKTFSNIKTIRLNTASGDITIKKGSGSDVKVLVKYSYSDEDYKVILEQNESRLTLKEEFSRSNNASGNSSWTLEVPDNLSITMNTGSGDITVDKVSLTVKSNTGSGDMTLTDVNGTIDFNAGSGEIEMTNVSGEVSMNTGSGDIRATNGNGNYAFNAGSGDIRLEQMKGDFNMNTGSGSVNAKNITIEASSSFNTGSGRATVVLNGPLNHNISVNSGSGDATLNFNGSEISGEVVMTADARHGDIVAPFKFDREETIDDGHSDRIRKTARIGSKNIRIKVGTGSGTAEIIK